MAQPLTGFPPNALDTGVMEGAGRVSTRAANDVAIRLAAIAEAFDKGVDALGPTAVARRAGLTTGAVYGRFEDTTELIVDLWLNGLADAVGDFLVTPFATVPRVLVDPPTPLTVGLEVVAVARRDNALAEVVHPSLSRVIEGLGAGPDAADPAHRARVLLRLAISCGLALLGDWGPAGGTTTRAVPEREGVPAGLGSEAAGGGEIDWDGAASRVDRQLAAGSPLRLPPSSDSPEPAVELWFPSPDDLDPHDVTRSHLLYAAMDVIAGSGVQRATVSRIARRAGLSHGALYGPFGSKEELVADAVRVVSAMLGEADARAGAELLARTGNFGAVSQTLLGDGGSPQRRVWRQFRLECFVTQRHQPVIAASLDESLAPMLASGSVLVAEVLHSDLPVARAQRRMIYAARVGQSLLGSIGGVGIDHVRWELAASLLGIAPGDDASG